MIGTLEQIFDYEQVEDAWKTILGRNGQTVYLEFCDDNKDASKVPYIEVQLNNVVPTGNLFPYRDELLPFWWKANLISRVVTMRGVNSDLHRGMVGRVRIEIQRYQMTFIESILPYHRVAEMRETALTRGVDDMNDWSEIHASVVFHVRDDAWPE